MTRVFGFKQVFLLSIALGATDPTLLAQTHDRAGSAAVVMRTPAGDSRTLSAGDSAEVAKTLRELYAAFSAGDRQKYRSFLADDYRLLENGELLDAEGDLALMPPAGSGYHRSDAFDFRSVTIRGDVACAVYYLTSEIRDQKGSRHRSWLESAVLVNSGAGWRLSLLHSTRRSEPAGQ